MQGTADDREREGANSSIYTQEMGDARPDKSTDFPWATQSQGQPGNMDPVFEYTDCCLEHILPSPPIYSMKFMTWHYPGTLGCQFPLQFYKISFGRREKFMLLQ